MKLLGQLEKLQTTGRGRWMACCPAHPDHTPSLSIRCLGHRFLLHCFAGCPVELILQSLGLSWGDLYDPDALMTIKQKPNSREQKAQVRLEQFPLEGRQRGQLEQLWKSAQPLSGDDLASRYLRFRGLRLNQIPASLRYVAALEYHQGHLVGVFPALVAKVVHPWQGMVALHRTYLRADGLGKAPVPAAKKLTRPIFEGATRGAALRLGIPGSRLALAEGLETALAVQEMTGWTTWASLGAGGMGVLEVPETVREVLIAADHDPVNPKTSQRPGEAAALALASRLSQQGKKVFLAIPPDEGSDWLDGYRAGLGIWGHSRLWVRQASGSNQPPLAAGKPYLGHPATPFQSSRPTF